MQFSRGVLTVAHGHLQYAEYARDLARSIRFHGAATPLAVATDLPHSEFAGLFDHVIEWDFSQYPRLMSKLEIYDASPFDATLFIDSDCFVLQPLAATFRYFGDCDFNVYGRMMRRPGWFQYNFDNIHASTPAEAYPVFNGGVYFFRKSALAARIFRRAKELRREYKSLRLPITSKGIAEEPLISIAMAEVGLAPADMRTLDVMYFVSGGYRSLCVDVVRGKASVFAGDRLVHPHIVHFAHPWTGSYLHRRESRRMALAYAKGMHSTLTRSEEAIARASAVAAILGRKARNVRDRVHRRLRAVF
jgi:hypothetical protein